MEIEKIDNGRSFDWSLTSESYAKYRDIYPKILYDELRKLGVAKDGSAWLDIGTGTGVLPKHMYNENARIIGIDISDEQIKYAQKLAKENNQRITYLACPAESTGLEAHSVDAITAAQCFWYFDKEVIKSEIQRLLKPNGLFIKVYLTWTLDDEIAYKSHMLIKEYNRSWTPGKSGSRDMFDDLFEGRVTKEFECSIPFTRESWHGRMCACRGTLASMDENTFESWSAAHKKMLEAYPEEFEIKHKLYITYFKVI
ncbi:MAG: methyltransferase domain-containing protein [Ruminococcaceae bacterium]|nr:methyltransferase domain-containing protein [Oscillospiraceae bacterium]